MCGYKTIVGMVNGMIEELGITVPVALHLDHGSYEGAKACINAGFSSIMFDGSSLPIEENIAKTTELVNACGILGLSLEAEVGSIGGEEDGVVGAGGAGFPSYAKLTDKADTILLNCAECEPLLKLHRQLLEKHAYEIMKTFHTVMETVGASQAIIGIKKSYVQTVKALQQHIEEFPGLKLHLLDEVYPMGDEVVLILSLIHI